MPAFSERILRAALTRAAALMIILIMLLGTTACALKDSEKSESKKNTTSQDANPTGSQTGDPAGPNSDPATPTEAPATPTLDPNAMDWSKTIEWPTAEEIAECNKAAKDISPYLAAWMKTGDVGRYTEYAIDFKADYLPDYTYCCLANFMLDYSALNSQYAKVNTDGGIAGYAGFQRLGPDQDHVAIMSFWDIYCEDESGNKTTISATRLYPGPDDNMRFGGEGEGVHCITACPWEAGKWYRMKLECGTNEETGNTTIAQWIKDLSTGEWTMISKYDLGVKNVAFTGDNAIFLENFGPATAGEVRTMEVKNARVRAENGSWVPVKSGVFMLGYEHAGSYKYGTEGDTFWMITTGVTGKAGEPQQPIMLTVPGGEEGEP